jgi:RNA polymerase sigma factor (sigma-70 family)
MNAGEELRFEDPRALACSALAFARERLGPASERVLMDPQAQTVVLGRMRSGVALEDAVLGEVFRAGATDRQAADEFLGHLLPGLMERAHPQLTRGLRRFLDTGDLVQSVLGDLWPELLELRFESRAQFVSLLAQRLRWKASNTTRRLERGRRREDLRSAAPAEELELADDGPSPLSELGSSEEGDLLILALMKLSERDQLILRLHLKAEPLEVIARETGLKPEAARKALQRAIRRARDLVR